MAGPTNDPRDLTKEQHVIPHWYDSDSRYLEFVQGNGAKVVDSAGNEYWDFISQMISVNLGHGNQTIINAMKDQLDRIQFVGSFHHNDTRTRLAERIVEHTPESLNDVYFAVSGSQANEAAIQFARQYTGKHKILTRWRSYHGSTYASAGLGGEPANRQFERYAQTTGNVKFLPPLARSPLGDRIPFDAESPEALARQAVDHVEYVIRNEDPSSIAALMMEPVGGSAGAYTAPPGYFEGIRRLCDKHNILLIADEVLTGFGRCGEWFGIDTEGITPDVMTVGKGITGSYAPLAAVILDEEIGTALRNDGISVGQTFGGHPIACAAGNGAMDEYEDGMINAARNLESTFEQSLESLKKENDAVSEVRGTGCLWAIEFIDPQTGEPIIDGRLHEGENPVAQMGNNLRDNGVLVQVGRPPTQIILAPPFCMDTDDLEDVIALLGEEISSTFHSLGA